MSDAEYLRKKLEREQKARSEAEFLLEAKSRELFISNEELRQLNGALEDQVQRRVAQLSEAKIRSQIVSEERQRLRLVVEGLPNAMVMIDDQLHILLMNAQMENLFGFSREELVGQRIDILVPDRYRSKYQSAANAYRRSPIPYAIGMEGDVYGMRKDGAEVPIEIFLNPIQIQEGLMVLASVVDITERIRTERRMQALNAELSKNARQLASVNERLRQTSRAKSEFLASMSHELRTPLNGILGMNELLRGTELNERQRKYVDASSSSGKLLVQLINDVLDLSKIEAGKLEIHRVKCNIESLVYDVAEIMSYAASQKGLSLQCMLAAETSVVGMCDDNRLRQVLVNLVGNAVKFTASGNINIKSQRIADRNDKPWFRFAVTDTGIGIPKNRRNRLFQVFSQVDSSTTRRYGGSGLGLSICKQLVELMGGRIDVASEVGVGSTFWFEIPVEIVEESGLKLRQQYLKGINVLLYGQVGEQQEQIKNSFRNWGCHLYSTTNGAEAVAQLQEAEDNSDPFALALVPARTFGGDHSEPLQILAQFENLQVIAICSSNEEVDTELLHSRGVDRVLREPVRPSTLFDTICALRSNEASVSDVSKLRIAMPTAKFQGHVLVAEDIHINQMYIEELLKNLGCTVDMTSNGEEAIAALESGTYDLVLMDCQMPEMDGFSATREIRKREAARSLQGRRPIVALTANALEGDRERCLEAGMDDHVCKPLAVEDLQNVLARFLKEEAGTALPGPPRFPQNELVIPPFQQPR